MDAAERRKKIVDILAGSERPVSASSLAAEFSVSRQIIVGDIALLRASDIDISATPRGYIIASSHSEPGIVRQIACCHKPEDMQTELYAVVDQGCTVRDVIVEHPVYGQITGILQVSSRYDVDQFIRKCSQYDALPLSYLTGGIHLHTIICPDEGAYKRVIGALRTLGFILEH